MPPISARLILAAVISLFISACDGESAPPETAATEVVVASIELMSAPCDARLHDSGGVLYVIMRKDCLTPASQVISFQERAGATTRGYSVEFPGWNVTMEIPFAAAGAREITFFESGTWREIPNQNSWQPRDGGGLLIKDGVAYLLGGWLHGPVTNEVWRSSNLVDWEFLGFAPWPPRHGSAWLMHHGRMFVIGGDMIDDVWSSADGVTWRADKIAAPFGKRYTPNAVSIGRRIIVYAGLRWLPNDWCERGQLDCTVEGLNDVWQSTDDGRTWERIVEQAPWPGRGLIHGSIVHDGEIFLIGGGLKVVPSGQDYSETAAEMTDIWSSPDGRSWTQRASTLPFPGRTHFSVAETSFGCVVSDGSVGSQDNVSNNLYIAPDCLNFVELPDAPLPMRHASAVKEFNGTLVILGGPPAGGAGTAIWQYVP